MNLSSINGVSKNFSDSDQSLDTPTYRSKKRGSKKRVIRVSPWKRFKGLGFLIGLLGLFFLVNWWMLSRLNHSGFVPKISSSFKKSKSPVIIKEDLRKIIKVNKPQKTPFGRLLKLAAHALAEGQNKPEPKGLWEEPYDRASNWKPCAEERDWEPSEGNNGYIMVTANGGLNQQRVAVCNAVAVARLLNATLVLPKFMFSSVWRDASQFGDIYQEEHFINYLKPDIRIVKELPEELQSLDLDAIDSVVTDENIMKEAKPSFYRKNILPLLLRNKVIHFLGFGNRLAFDPVPSQLQRLRCRCNFYALQFVPKIQEGGALILQRIRQNSSHAGLLDSNLVGLSQTRVNPGWCTRGARKGSSHQHREGQQQAALGSISYNKTKLIKKNEGKGSNHLLGPYAKKVVKGKRGHSVKGPKYLALHLRFEIDMVAHSLCKFGGGEEERKELEAYRQIHFPALTRLEKNEKLPTPDELRSEGLCPLTPEEAVLMLAALGFNRKTHIFLAGAQIYGGQSRLASLTSLYPHLVTKENLLSPSELEPFKNFSSQLAALDFIGCTASSAFAMTDSGSQLSALVSGFRMYYGGGQMPTIRPNKRRLADIFLKNTTIEWKVFEQRVRKAVRQTKQIHQRPTARSIYRHPRCKECMCLLE